MKPKQGSDSLKVATRTQNRCGKEPYSRPRGCVLQLRDKPRYEIPIPGKSRRSCTAGAAGRLVSAAHGFPGIRQNASIRIAPRVHMGNVGSIASSSAAQHLALPLLPGHTLTHPNKPHHVLPATPRHTKPYKARPCPAHRACQTLPCRDQPQPTSPATPSPTPTNLALTNPACLAEPHPVAPCRTAPNLALPCPACQALPYPATPRVTLPFLPRGTTP